MSQASFVEELRIALLGTLSVSRAPGRSVVIPSRPQRRLLVALALQAGEVVLPSTLEERLSLSPGALRTSISRLRRLIGPDALETTALGYRLRADVDVATFEQLVSVVPDLGDVAARPVLEEAVGLWRGDPLVEFAGEVWAEPIVRRLEEMHATAVEDLAVLQLDAGEIAPALVAVRILVGREPFRERAQALLVRALAEGGRATEALRAFQDYCALLRDEVGTRPSGALSALDLAVAASIETSTPLGRRLGDPAWTRARRSVPAPTHRHGPPVPLTSFVGRHQELSTVIDLVRDHRLVSLTGSGGCGKTRLAIAAAAAEADRRATGVRWVELGVVVAPADVVEHVAAAVGFAAVPGIEPTVPLAEHLADEGPMLLVIDNAEHLLAPVATLLDQLLARCESLHVLVTSREPLGVAGEVIWRVPSLSSPPVDARLGVDDITSFGAVQLFVDRARDARPGIVLEDEALRHVAAICAGVDGLPFAIELAAARARTMPIEAVASGINDAVRWQSSVTRAPIGRHATLHASIAWSVDLVEPLARAVLLRLAAFQSSFTLDAALAVGSDGESPDRVADAVAALVDASLLQFDDVTGRFRMLHTIRRFCTMRAAPDQLARARSRHAHHLASFCAEVGAGRRGIERGQFIREMPDLVVAMEWAREHEPTLAFAMCAGLASVRSALGHHGNVADTWAWLVSLDRGADADEWTSAWATAVAAQMAAATAHWIDVGGVVEEVDRVLPTGAERARSWLARGAAMVPAYQGRLGPILAHVDDVRSRRDDLEDSIYGGFAAYMLALSGRLDESELHVRELERLTRRHRTSFRVDTVGNGYAAAVIVDLFRGRLASAVARGDQPTPADPAFSMTAAAALAHVALVTGDRPIFDRAVEWSRQRTIPLLRFLPTFIELVGVRLDGEIDHAADLAEVMWEQAEAVPLSRVHPLSILTTALIDAGRLDRAAAMTEEAAVLVASMDPAPLLAAGVLASRAMIAARAGSVGGAGPPAAPCLAELLELTTRCGLVPMKLEALEQTAAVADDPVVAATLRAAADLEWRRIGARRSAAPDGAFDEGPTIPFADALALARDVLAPSVPRPMSTDAQV